MRCNKNLGLWIAALSVAGSGWLMTLGVWGCEVDPWGLASAIIPEKIGTVAVAMLLRHGGEGCVFAALILLTTGLIEEATDDERPVRRRSPVRDHD
jgi:hypothetical protein